MRITGTCWLSTKRKRKERNHKSQPHVDILMLFFFFMLMLWFTLYQLLCFSLTGWFCAENISTCLFLWSSHQLLDGKGMELKSYVYEYLETS